MKICKSFIVGISFVLLVGCNDTHPVVQPGESRKAEIDVCPFVVDIHVPEAAGENLRKTGASFISGGCKPDFNAVKKGEPGKPASGHLVITFFGDTPFVDLRTGKPTKVIPTKGKRQVIARSIEDGKCTIETGACKYSVVFIPDDGQIRHPVLDPEVIIVE